VRSPHQELGSAEHVRVSLVARIKKLKCLKPQLKKAVLSQAASAASAVILGRSVDDLNVKLMLQIRERGIVQQSIDKVKEKKKDLKRKLDTMSKDLETTKGENKRFRQFVEDTRSALANV
jgi:hypothetical protein